MSKLLSWRYSQLPVLLNQSPVGFQTWNRRLWERKKSFSPDRNRNKVPHLFQSISTWNVRNILYFCLKITDSYISTERQCRFRISKVYFKIPLRGRVVCLFPPRLATHVSKLPSPQTSRLKEFWLCQIFYCFWGHQTQAGIISGRYK